MRDPKAGVRQAKLLSRPDRWLLRSLALERPTDSLREIARRFADKRGVKLSRDTVAAALTLAGLVRVKPRRTDVSNSDERDKHRFTDKHRPRGPDGGYPSSLTDKEWGLVEDIFSKEGRGRPPKYPRRLMVDACCYVVKTGCSWRMLPHDFPKWEDVYATFRRWSDQGLFEQMNARFVALWREREGRKASPSAAIVDSQSIGTSPQGGPRGIDANKKIKGRKRHLVTDTLGLVLAVLVTAASTQDYQAADDVLATARQKYGSLKALYADSAYQGKCADRLRDAGLDVLIVRRGDRHGAWSARQTELTFTATFTVLPKRWIIERTNAWTSHNRRLARDYDRLTDVSTSWIWLAQGRILLRRTAATL